MQFLFMHTILRSLSQGRNFRKLFALFLRVIAALCLIGYLILGADLLSKAGSYGGAVQLGGVVYFICLLIGAYMVVHTLLIRAAEILRLPDSDFTVIPAFSLFLRLIGEVMAWSYVTVGVGGGLLFLLAGASVPNTLRSNLPLARSLPYWDLVSSLSYVESGGFLGGMTLMLASVLIGFVLLVFCYLLSEAAIVLLDIAGNLRIMRLVMTGAPVAPGNVVVSPDPYASSAASVGPMTQVVPAPQAVRCYHCGNTLQPGSAFCERCGTRVS